MNFTLNLEVSTHFLNLLINAKFHSTLNTVCPILDFQEVSLKYQSELKQEFDDIKRLLRQILSSNGQDSRADSSPIWPLRTIEELEEAEKFIKITANFKNEVC